MADDAAVTNGEGSTVNTALARILFWGDIFPLLVGNRNKLNMIARDGFLLTQEHRPFLWSLQQTWFPTGDTGLLLGVLGARLMIGVLFAAETPN